LILGIVAVTVVVVIGVVVVVGMIVVVGMVVVVVQGVEFSKDLCGAVDSENISIR
jgi:hypothetical protein